MLLSYVVIIVLCLSASVVALVMLNKIGDNLTSFYNNNYTVTVSAWRARQRMQSARADILRSILETNKTDKQAVLDKAATALADMRGEFPIIREHFRGDMALMDRIDQTLVEAQVSRDKVYELTLAQLNDEAFEVMKNEYVPMLGQMSDLLDQVTTQSQNNAKLMVEQGEQLQTTSIITVLVIAVLCIALAMVLGIYISNGIRKPVAEIEQATKKLAGGELGAVLVTYESKDELGSLSDSIRSLIKTFRGIIEDMGHGLSNLGNGDFTVDSNAKELYVGDFRQLLVSMYQIIDSLSSTLGQINQVSNQVFAGSDQVSSGAQALSQGAAEQAASVEELAATINDISSQVKENAQSAQHGSQLAKTAGMKMEEGNRQMQEMITAMAEIRDSSSQIGKIIKTIKDIALQTNILALNAAVEAARAGAAGKGFAVVADEVRHLASKSAEASKSTAILIEGSIHAVEKGTKLADETAQTLTEVVQTAKQVVTVVNSISQASNEQASSIAQVTQGINQISSVVQTTSATAEESAAASEELSGQAQMLKNLVEKFKLPQTGKESYSSVLTQIQQTDETMQWSETDGK